MWPTENTENPDDCAEILRCGCLLGNLHVGDYRSQMFLEDLDVLVLMFYCLGRWISALNLLGISTTRWTGLGFMLRVSGQEGN